MFDFRQEILKSHPFLMSRKFETQGHQWKGSNGLNLQIRGIVKQGYEPLQSI